MTVAAANTSLPDRWRKYAHTVPMLSRAVLVKPISSRVCTCRSSSIFLSFSFMSAVFPGLYRSCVFVIVFVKPHIAVQQGGSAVNALSGALVLDWDNIAVAVGLTLFPD